MPRQSTITEERLYFLCAVKGAIATCRTDGSDLLMIRKDCHETPDGIVVDKGAGHIYWTNMGALTSSGNAVNNDGSIERMDLDGGNRRFIVPRGGTFTPKQLKLDLTGGRIYWCDREGMRIMRCRLDGSNIETLVDTSQGDPRPGHDARKWCVGIALDFARQQMYWTQKGSDNANQGRLFRAGMSVPKGESPSCRSDVELLFQNLPEPIDLELITETRLLYWTDRGDPPRGNSLNRSKVDGLNPATSKPDILDTGLKEGIGLAIDEREGRAYITDLGGDIYSCNIDGSNMKTLISSGVGPLTGICFVHGA
jgi:hypothetical protein